MVIKDSVAEIRREKSTLHLTLSPSSLKFVTENDALWVSVPASSSPLRFTLALSAEPIPALADVAQPDLITLTQGGPERWPATVETEIVLGEDQNGYAADEVKLPFANPYGTWMRTTCLDFFPDGRIAVGTLSGDIYLVTPNPADPLKLTWKRFATGLYEPLGLKIVDGKIYVRGRDRITRLHDFNNDNEADFYEVFFEEPDPVGSGYHSFIFELQTDQAGNFYYSKSGRSSPHKAAITRISPEGKTSEIIGGDLRHPNGMGFGGPKNWLTISDNPSGLAVYNGVSLVREGGSYGYERARNQPMLAVLPAVVDASSGGQCWADAGWGPLGGQMIHTSYSHGTAFYILTQDIGEHPNGFAIAFPFEFASGVMRPRVNPVDKQVYLVGQKGWDTKARQDGSFHRIRSTGKPAILIDRAAVTATGLSFRFTQPLDPASVTSSAVKAEFMADKDPEKYGKVALGELALTDPQTIHLTLPDLDRELVKNRLITDKKTKQPGIEVHYPIAVTLSLKTTAGQEFSETIYVTINSKP